MKWFILLLILVNTSFALEDTTNSLDPSVTNISGEISTEKRLPNIYLKNQTTEQHILSFARRYDAVYFIAIPVTYYLTFNLIQQKNWYLNQTYDMNRADELFLYFNTFFLPLIVAYVDYVYVENYTKKNLSIQKYEIPFFVSERNKNLFYLEFYRKEF
ncbi:MAG: hypothetical protein ACP5QT_07740 [Brevinematia bacterium]